MSTRSRERAAVQARAPRFLDDLCGGLAICTGRRGMEAEIAETLGAPVSFLGVGLPDDRIHAPNERVTLPLLHRGAEAAAHLWRLLGSPTR